jgi:hypothetical protein
MLKALFAACGLLVGTLIVGGAVVGVMWLAISTGGVLGYGIAIAVALGMIAG